MSLIAASDQGKLRRRFRDELRGDARLHLTAHAGECALCRLAGELVREIVSLSERLTFAVETSDGTCPAIELRGGARGVVRFVGVPSGYELPAFIDSIVDVSRGRTSLGSDTLERLDALERPVHVQVFTTPT